jgi:hypothetical protein
MSSNVCHQIIYLAIELSSSSWVIACRVPRNGKAKFIVCRLAQMLPQAIQHGASGCGLSENRWPHGRSARAVDEEGEVLDVLVQSKRNKHATLKLMRKLLKKYGFVPDRMITDDLRSYSAAARDLGIEACHERGRWILSTHAVVYNTFNAQRHQRHDGPTEPSAQRR